MAQQLAWKNHAKFFNKHKARCKACCIYGCIFVRRLLCSSPDTLVKLDILQLHSLGLGAPAGVFKQDFVVESEPELWQAGEVDSHFDGSFDVWPEHVAVGRRQQVDALDHVEENLVLAVLEALLAPGHGIRHRRRRSRHDLKLMRLLGDVLLCRGWPILSFVLICILYSQVLIHRVY